MPGRLFRLESFHDDRFEAFHACREGSDRALLVVQNMAQVLDETLEKAVTSFELRKSLFSHARRLAETRTFGTNQFRLRRG